MSSGEFPRYSRPDIPPASTRQADSGRYSDGYPGRNTSPETGTAPGAVHRGRNLLRVLLLLTGLRGRRVHERRLDLGGLAAGDPDGPARVHDPALDVAQQIALRGWAGHQEGGR